MRIGIANLETWGFLHEIADDLAQHHQVSVFKPRVIQLPVFHMRVNRWLYRHDIAKFMAANDMVFFEWASELLATATRLPKTCGIVTRLHRYEMYEWVDRIYWDAVDKIILVSQTKKQEFRVRFPEQAEKIEVIYEAVDPDKFQFQPKTFGGDIGLLCHLTPRKRVYELILTFAELLRQRSDLHLHIGGGADPSYLDYAVALYDLVRNLKLQDKVTFYDNVKEPWKWYGKVDIFISNGYSEGLQVAPMEAMACGCYCLAHRWMGADELLPAAYLYYTDRELQEKILAYCALPSDAQQAERATMRAIVVEKFNVHQTKIEVRRVLEAVGDQTARPSGAHPAPVARAAGKITSTNL
jgi:glycosyltransferase involved in cell wall biosynthesis